MFKVATKTLGKTFGKVAKKVSAKSQLILTVCSIIGVCETVYLTSKAAPKAKEALEEAREEKGEDLTVVEKVKVAAPIYAPVAASAAVTTGCIIANHRIGAKKLRKAVAASMAARKAYQGLVKEFDDYKGVVKDVAGEEAFNIIEDKCTQLKLDKLSKDSSITEKIKNAPGTKRPDSLLCWLPADGHGHTDVGDFFWASEQELGDAEGKINKQFQECGWVNLDSYRGYFDIPYSDDHVDRGYNRQCECWCYRENDWIEIQHNKGKIGDIDCWIISFNGCCLCSNYENACMNFPEDQLPFK